METIISAGISTVGAIIICIVTQIVLAQRQTDALRADTREQTTEIKGDINVINTRIDNLAEKVARHNGFVERVNDLERISDVQAEQIKVANHRIEDLERRAMA